MGTSPPRAATRTVISCGHLLVGASALVFAGVMIVAGRDPEAELGGVLVGPGLILAVAAVLFMFAAVLVLRAGRTRRSSLSIVLSIVELLAGAAMVAGVAVAVQGYGAFEPWRSPILLPAVLLVALGLAGLRLGMRDDHRARPQPH
jgi:drug/metabolite transporter (DMT)-like permease